MPARIEFSESIPSYPDARLMFEDILQKMFPEHSRILVEEEFVGDSFSGSWVFLAQRFRDRRPELPVVVKIASVSLIEKEWQAYNEHIRDKWPRTAPIRNKPVVASDGALSGLYYDVAGEGLSSIESIRSYCLKESTIIEDIQEVLDDFAKEMDYVIDQYGDKEFRIYLRAIYDPVLPVNLLIEPASLPTGVEPTVVSSGKLPISPPKLGTYVRLEGFVVTKVDLKRHTVTLNLPHPTDDLPDNSYCVRLKFESREEMPAYTFGQDVPVVEGLIVRTRYSQWQDEMAEVLAGQTFDLDGVTVFRPDGAELPNPFSEVERILGRHRNIVVGPIHGDMNLGNILVDTDVNRICLIDFAEVRRDHVLHDFLRLETEVVTKLIPPALVEAGLPVEEAVCSLYEELHCAPSDTSQNTRGKSPDPALDKAFAILKRVRQVARDQGLYKQDDYAEYYDGLTLYLLGALKFGNLDKIPETPAPLPKQAAFWAAASARRLLHQPRKQKRKRRGHIIVWIAGIIAAVALILAAILMVDDVVGPEPTSWSAFEECEYPDEYTVGQMIWRSNASDSRVHGQFGTTTGSRWPAKSGHVTYNNINIPPIDHLYLRLRYSKDSPSTVPILVYIDGEPRATLYPMDQEDWNQFVWTEPILLGNIGSGVHSLKFYTDGQQYGVADLDRFVLTDESPSAHPTKTSDPK